LPEHFKSHHHSVINTGKIVVLKGASPVKITRKSLANFVNDRYNQGTIPKRPLSVDAIPEYTSVYIASKYLCVSSSEISRLVSEEKLHVRDLEAKNLHAISRRSIINCMTDKSIRVYPLDNIDISDPDVSADSLAEYLEDLHAKLSEFHIKNALYKTVNKEMQRVMKKLNVISRKTAQTKLGVDANTLERLVISGQLTRSPYGLIEYLDKNEVIQYSKHNESTDVHVPFISLEIKQRSLEKRRLRDELNGLHAI